MEYGLDGCVILDGLSEMSNAFDKVETCAGSAWPGLQRAEGEKSDVARIRN
jgi:hypothetical protein